MKEIFGLWLIGPNRFSDEPVRDQLFRLDSTEAAVRVDERRLLARLSELGLRDLAEALGAGESRRGLGDGYLALVMGLQRWAGHQVGPAVSLPRADANEFHVVWGHEHDKVAWVASLIAMALLVQCHPELGWPEEFGKPLTDLENQLPRLRDLGAATRFPPDSECLLRAARRRGVPCLKLERQPYDGVKGPFRLRMNSMLKLGHCAHRRVLDGMLCIERSGHANSLYHDRASLRPLSEKYRFPIPPSQYPQGQTVSLDDALASAAALGYPVVLKPRRRSHGRGVTVAIRDDHGMPAAVDQALQVGQPLLVEKHLPGASYRVLVANHDVVGVYDELGIDRRAEAAPSILELASNISRGEHVGLLEMTVVTKDISKPIAPDGTVVVDVDHAPRLDRFLEPHASAMVNAVEGFLDWIYPPGTQHSVPVVAITGTNGKTTTTRMVARMLSQAGRVAAMVCTDGAYVFRGDQVEEWEEGSFVRFRQLVEPDIEAVVQECHFGMIARQGFAWHRCDVGVVTNVTPDHIGRLGVESVEAMADLKSSVVRRARSAVLNADDPLCMAMAGDLDAENLYLVTLSADASSPRAKAGRAASVITCQPWQGRDWLVLDEAGSQTPIVAVDDIPATFGGAARHNVSNAQHAIAAGLATGLSATVISQALSTFAMSFETTPGRLNLHDNGRYRVILDYAHNEDGFRQLVSFVDGLSCKGRKILVYAVSAEIPDDLVKTAAAVPSGHFDFYVCKSYASQDVRPPGEIPQMMRASLLASGVAPEAIAVEPDGWKALDLALSLAAEHDLLVVLTGRLEFGKAWTRITAA